MSDWSEKTVKCQTVIKQRTCFPFKRYQQKGKRNLSDRLKVTHPIMHCTQCNPKALLFTRLTLSRLI